MTTLIIEGTIVSDNSEAWGQVEINTKTGLIEKVGSSLGPADMTVSHGLIFPGFGDVHVHAREDASGTQAYKEDFHTMSQAAIQGGVVHVADMPNNPVAPLTETAYAEKKSLADTSLIDVTLYGGIGPSTRPLSFDAPYKVFMGPSVGDLFFTSQGELARALAKYKGRSISFHCEDPQILQEYKTQERFEERRPREAEIRAVDFAISLIEKYDLVGKICHCSTKEGVEKIREAKAGGLALTSEVTPHHLYFDDTMLTPANRTWLQVNPPLRRTEDRLALILALKDGTIDYLASDHAPHTRKEKKEGVSGFPHLDTYGAFATWLMKEHGFTSRDIVRVCAANPGKFVNPYLAQNSGKGFGKIEEGYIGSLTILDPTARATIVREELKTKCGWSPFEGVEFPGRVTHTIIRGRIYET